MPDHGAGHGQHGRDPSGETFLQDVRDLCDKHGILLVFDEVITGFRIAYGGAQEMYGVRPDLTCLGKIIGRRVPYRRLWGKA